MGGHQTNLRSAADGFHGWSLADEAPRLVDESQIDDHDVQSFVDYWRSTTGSHPVPSRRAFDLLLDRPRLCSFSYQIDLRGACPIFRLVGSTLATTLGRDSTGRAINSSTMGRAYGWIAGALHELTHHPRVLALRGTLDWVGRPYLSYQSAVVPAAEEMGGPVTRIFGILKTPIAPRDHFVVQRNAHWLPSAKDLMIA